MFYAFCNPLRSYTYKYSVLDCQPTLASPTIISGLFLLSALFVCFCLFVVVVVVVVVDSMLLENKPTKPTIQIRLRKEHQVRSNLSSSPLFKES